MRTYVNEDTSDLPLRYSADHPPDLPHLPHKRASWRGKVMAPPWGKSKWRSAGQLKKHENTNMNWDSGANPWTSTWSLLIVNVICMAFSPSFSSYQLRDLTSIAASSSHNAKALVEHCFTPASTNTQKTSEIHSRMARASSGATWHHLEVESLDSLICNLSVTRFKKG